MSNFIKIIPIGLLVIAMAVLIAYFNQPSPQASPGPTISWTQSKITETISPGDSKSVEVSFVADKNLENVSVLVVAELRPYVEVSPSIVSYVNAGVPYAINIIFTAPVKAELETFDGIFDGTIQIRNKKIYAKPLPVTLSIWQSFVNQDGGYAILAPPDWQVITRTSEDTSTILIPPDRSPDPDLEYIGDIIIDKFPNTDNLSLTEFYQAPGTINLFEASMAHTSFQLNGFDAVRFESALGHIPSTVVAVNLGECVIEIIDDNERHQTDGIFDNVVSSFIAF
ncbi:MAG: hypothetical protein WBD99_02610 [Thermodesulfobacteriota bacterium]